MPYWCGSTPGHLKLQHVQLAILHHQLGAVHLNLKAIGAVGIAGGGHKHARGAVGIFHVGGYVVLHLNVVPLAKAHL